MFYRGSRYEAIDDAKLDLADGRTIRYKRVRFVPDPPEVFAHITAKDERLDLIAWKIYRDPEQFWRICDANQALRPDELTEKSGRRLSIPVPTS